MRMATIGRWMVMAMVAAGLAWAQSFTRDDVLNVLEQHVRTVVRQNNGVYIVKDPESGKPLRLKLVEFHRAVRRIRGYGYFVCADFRPVDGSKDQLYDIDFWVKPENGQLKVMEARVHKVPHLLNGTWVQKSLKPLPWWWAIAGEHGGEAVGGERKAWEIKAAIHTYVKKNAERNNGYFTIRDDQTGQTLMLEMVRIHEPIRKLIRTGQYFACVDFREKDGPPQKLWDLDFWVEPRNGRLEVVKVRVHKEPKLINGEWVKSPRYKWEGEQIKDISYEIYDYGDT